jgi:hypothetical protein
MYIEKFKWRYSVKAEQSMTTMSESLKSRKTVRLEISNWEVIGLDKALTIQVVVTTFFLMAISMAMGWQAHEFYLELKKEDERGEDGEYIDEK